MKEKLLRLKQIIAEATQHSETMRQRLSLYIILILSFFLALVLLLMNLFGIVNPASAGVNKMLSAALNESVKKTEYNAEVVAAYADSFSVELSAKIEQILDHEKITFDELLDNQQLLMQIQQETYPIVYAHLKAAPCSGIFYFLNTTVNSSLPSKSNTGLYLKFKNIYSENTIYNDITMFRGFPEIARNNRVSLHNNWDLENPRGTFPQLDGLARMKFENGSFPYILTDVSSLNSGWENVRMVAIPVVDKNSEVIGVCGYEISNLYLQLVNKQDRTHTSKIIYGLFRQHGKYYDGQISFNPVSYNMADSTLFTMEKDGKFTRIKDDGFEYVAKTKPVTLGESDFIVAAMISHDYYVSYVHEGVLKVAAILLIVMSLALVSSIFISKRYLSPIMKGLERIKSNDRETEQSGILEIDDLFGYLAEKNDEHESEIRDLKLQRTTAQKQAQLAQDNYEKTKTKYETVQSEIDRLAYERNKEINPDDYQAFVEGIEQLTPTEREIFGYYLQGHTVKEIMEIAEIKESTLRYHNRNIYSKLGVNSLKQLLRYAALLKWQKDQKDN